MTTSVFDHLWFLWFLCWMVAGFAIAERLGFWSLHGPLRGNRNLWLLPATILPQLFMGAEMPVFGPDTSTGLLPMPHLLVYYAIFFAFGAAHFDAREQQQNLGNRYWLLIGSSVFLVLPLGLVMMGQRIPRQSSSRSMPGRSVSGAWDCSGAIFPPRIRRSDIYRMLPIGCT